MSNKLILRDVTIRGELDQDNELEMDFYTGHAWIYRAEAKKVVDHFTEVFGLDDWIKIEDEQPTHGQNVQAIGTWYGEIEEYGEDNYQGIGEWRDGIVYMDTDTCSTQIHNITHWKPLKWPGD